MNFPLSITNVLISLNWATAEEDYTSGSFGFSLEFWHLTFLLVLPPSDIPESQVKSERQRHRLSKRKAISDLLSDTREELFAGEFEG